MRNMTPILSADGQHYCSPSCGRGCRKEWYDAAVRNALALAARMGDGWEPQVWENLGWHYRVTNGIGMITVNENKRAPFDPVSGYPVDSYSAWISTSATCGDEKRSIQFIQDANDPEDAWGIVVQSARTFMANLNQALSDILNGEEGANHAEG